MKSEVFQTAIRMFFPPQCILCRTPLDRENALCGPCWRNMPFVDGAVCQCCGVPILGDAYANIEDRCETCHQSPPPWGWGRAAVRYHGQARKLVLALKHGDRQDIAVAAGFWMAQRIKSLITPETVLCPIPLHWRRKLGRRYNQSELLAHEMKRHLGIPVRPDIITRPRATIPLEDATQSERQARLANAFEINPRLRHTDIPQSVVLVDDVMTTGSTLAAAAMCLGHAGVTKINIVVLARVDRND